MSCSTTKKIQEIAVEKWIPIDLAVEPMAGIAGTAASVQGFTTTVGGAVLGFGIGQGFDGTSLPMTAGFAAAGVFALVIVLITEGGRLFHPRIGS
jgi:DHA1 family bicyclomycin/chloramphenicol resistance-like MFS transporter